MTEPTTSAPHSKTIVRQTKKPARPGRLIAGVFAFLLVLVMMIPLVVVTFAGSRVADSLSPKYSNTLEKMRRAEVMRRFVLPSDSSITPMRAGEALVSLGAREGQKLDPIARRAARGPYSLPAPDPSLFPDARPTEWRGPSSTKIIPAVQRGFTREEMDYLASLATNPIWEEYGLVARAPIMDIAGAAYKTPFPEGYNAINLPIMKFAATKEIAYANASRAAWYLANRHADSAEVVLRETISNGFKIIDNGNMLIDDLIGVVVVGIGRAGLEQLYEATKNPELERIRQESALIERTPLPAEQINVANGPQLARALADTTLPRGLRFEFVTVGNLAACTSVRGVLRGPPKEVETAMATARTQLVRTPAEGDLFDLSAHMIDRPNSIADGGAESGVMQKLIVWSAKVPSTLLRNPRISNCAGALSSTLQ